MYKFGVLTVSDRCSSGRAEDTSGPNLVKLLRGHHQLTAAESDVVTACVPDKVESIQRILLKWCDELNLVLILTTGGTGFSPNDRTPEATYPLLDREAPGFVTAMLVKSLTITPMAMLSRPVCGIRKNTIIVNLPGSRKGSQECLEVILPALPHAIDLLLDKTERVSDVHKQMSCPRPECLHGHEKESSTVKKRVRDDFYNVTLRPRQSPYPLLPVEDALSVILENTPVLPAVHCSTLLDAQGHVIAENVLAKFPLPPFPASVKDGYAVIASDGPGIRAVLSPVTAGEMPSMTLVSGSVSRITTGAPLPSGADAVVQVEDTELIEKTEDGLEEKVIKILSSVKIGQDVRSVGSDIAESQQVLSEGDKLRPAELGLLASVGVTKVTVYRSPRVGVLSTGNEVTSPGQPLRPGQIYDSNRVTIMAAVAEQGFTPLDMGIALDSRQSLVEHLEKGFSETDVIVTTGGVSMGEKDMLKQVLEEDFGAAIHFGRVMMKPGKPTTFATLEYKGLKKLVFGLPGNPVSAIVTFHLFVIPALKKMAGWAVQRPTSVLAKITFEISLDPRPEYHRVTLYWSDSDTMPSAISTGHQCSSRLLSMRSANAFLVLPARTESQTSLHAGAVVKAMLIGTGI